MVWPMKFDLNHNAEEIGTSIWMWDKVLLFQVEIMN